MARLCCALVLLLAFVVPGATRLAQAASPQLTAAPSTDLGARRKALNDIFAEYWEDHLSHAPEFASILGDKRFNDQLNDYSVDAYNQRLARERDYIGRLGAIDTTGMSDQEVLSKDLLVRQLIEDQEESAFKPWEMPVNQFNGLQLELPQLVPRLSFTTGKDYDDYIARLGKVPIAFRQITDNIMTGIDDQRVPPKYLLEKVLVQVNALLAQKPEDRPCPSKNSPPPSPPPIGPASTTQSSPPSQSRSTPPTSALQNFCRPLTSQPAAPIPAFGPCLTATRTTPSA